MLTAAEQEQIIRINNKAFEQRALRWQNPQTGETESDPRMAISRMVCDYLSVRGYSGLGHDLSRLISRLQDAALYGDNRCVLELTEEDIPTETRRRLKALYTDPDPGHWDWDYSEWDWELSLRDMQEDVDAGYVAIIPLKNGRRFKYKIEPPFSHNEWAIKFVPDGCPTILVKGSLQQAKRTLDELLRTPPPPIPNH